MENNCVVIREFEVPGGTYLPGRKLGLDATLLESWIQFGFVKPLVVKDPKPKKKRRKRTVKVTTLA